MYRDRLRSFLYEGARVLLVGVSIALIIVGGLRYFHRPTLEDFKGEYMSAHTEAQKDIAASYLSRFSAQELLDEIDGGDVDGVCHIRSHGIGRAVYSRSQNFTESIRQCGNACTFGCFHGAMMEMFATESDTLGGTVEGDTPEQYLERIKEVAPDLCWKPEVESVVRPRSCTHGLGHAFQSLTNDLDTSVASCVVLKNPKSIAFCRAGVFMEYLFNASSTADLYAKGARPCDRFPNDTVSCYQYKAYGWILAHGSVSAALRACDSLGENARTCYQSIGRAGTTETILESGIRLDALCSAATGDMRTACYIGAYQKAIDLDNVDNADHICDRVDPVHLPYCVSALQVFRESTTFQ